MSEPSNSSSLRINRFYDFLPRLYFPLLALLCAAYSWQPLTAGDDVWAHAAIGRWIVEHGQVPHQTLFVWGAAPIEWVYHSWLSQVAFYLLLERGEVLGPFLTLLGTAAVVAVVFATLWRAWLARSGSTQMPLWVPPIFALAIFCSSLRFNPRPELFTALFLSVTVLFLSRDPNAKYSIAALVGFIFMFALWANFHGAVAIGLLLLWATAICDAVQDVIQQRVFSSRAKTNLLLATACSIAIFINPYGLEYWRALQPVGGEAFSRIDEWKPFWHAPMLNPIFVAGEAILVMLAVCFWLGNKERRWSQFIWLLLICVLFLSARRHLWLLPIVALAVMSANARALSTPSLARLLSKGVNIVKVRNNARVLVVALLALWVLSAAPPPQNMGVLVANELPVRASQFLRSHYSEAPVFNDYENSSYLQWRFSGRPPLYIDLLNAYPDQLLLDYLDIAHARPRGQKLLDTQNIRVVILRKYLPESPLAKLAEHLNNHSAWRRVYKEDDGTIWLRRNYGASQKQEDHTKQHSKPAKS